MSVEPRLPGEWFRHDGLDMKWLAVAPHNSPARCDECLKEVSPREPRLLVDDKLGMVTAKSHGKPNSYLCEVCADMNGYPPMKKWS